MAETGSPTQAPKAPKAFTERLREKLPMWVALTAALLAAMAGIASLLMSRHSGKASSELIRSTNYWNYYQAKSLKSYILASEKDVLAAMGKTSPDADVATMTRLEEEKKEIKRQAEQYGASAEAHSTFSHLLADAVTLFQIAIANAAIAALSKKPAFWLISIALALVGVGLFAYYWLLQWGVMPM